MSASFLCSADRIRIISEWEIILEDEEIHTNQINLNFNGKLKFKNTINIRGIPISKPGKLSFKIIIDKKEEAIYTITVNPSELKSSTEN